jgi:hypothetical protein
MLKRRAKLQFFPELETAFIFNETLFEWKSELLD